MVRKSFETVVYVLSIGLLQYFTVDGCQVNSDCPTQASTASKQCCHNVYPPRCMARVICRFYGRHYTQQAPTFKPTVPSFRRLTRRFPPDYTIPDYQRFTVPTYPRFTLPPDYTIPDFNYFKPRAVPKFDPPTFNYKPNSYDGYNYGEDNNSSGSFEPAALGGTVAILILLTIIIFFLRWARCRSTTNHYVGRSLTNNTRRPNTVAEQSREPRRIVIVSVTQEENQVPRPQNQPPEGEPPFLSEEDILNNLQLNGNQKPPSYEETTTGRNLPNYENPVANSTIDPPPPPSYPEVQATSQSHIYPSQIGTPPSQQQLPMPDHDIQPPSYDESQAAATNEAVEALP